MPNLIWLGRNTIEHNNLWCQSGYGLTWLNQGPLKLRSRSLQDWLWKDIWTRRWSNNFFGFCWLTSFYGRYQWQIGPNLSLGYFSKHTQPSWTSSVFKTRSICPLEQVKPRTGGKMWAFLSAPNDFISMLVQIKTKSVRTIWALWRKDNIL